MWSPASTSRHPARPVRIDLTMLTHDPEHADAIVQRMREVEGVEIGRVSDRTFLMHLGGKLSVESKVPIRTRTTCRWSTPRGGPRAHGHRREPRGRPRPTIKRNTGSCSTAPPCWGSATSAARRAARHGGQGRAVQAVRRHRRLPDLPRHHRRRGDHPHRQGHLPGVRGDHLEDISAPRCFEIEARLREELDIPVFHDDQHGTAIVALAALRNALRVVGSGSRTCAS